MNSVEFKADSFTRKKADPDYYSINNFIHEKRSILNFAEKVFVDFVKFVEA